MLPYKKLDSAVHTMYCGIMLTGDMDKPCGVAFLDEEGVETFSPTGDEEILALVKEHNPSIVALNAAPEREPDRVDTPKEDSVLDPETASTFREGEQDLVDDGHAVLPREMRDRKLLERAEFIANSLKRAGIGCTIIESRPGVVAKMLDVATDDDLAQHDVDPSSIEHTREFDAALLALTARMHDKEETEDKDIIVPDEERRAP